MVAKMGFGRFCPVRISTARRDPEFFRFAYVEVIMKLVRLVNRFRPEKSLKAYAWYGWV
jgi:hypothetical protein